MGMTVCTWQETLHITCSVVITVPSSDSTSSVLVQCTKYQFLKLIRETSQLDLDRCLTSSITQFIGYFKYRIIYAYNPVCNITNCFVCAGS